MGCKVDTNIMEYEVAHIIKSCTNNVQYPDGVVYTMLNNVFFFKKKNNCDTSITSNVKNKKCQFILCISICIYLGRTSLFANGGW